MDFAEAAAYVFSIGVVLYELLSGRHPVADEPLSVMGMCMRLLTYQPPATLAASTGRTPEAAR